MSPQFNSMNDLTSYLSSLENRLKALETENASLKRYIADIGGDAGKLLPKTGLISNNFLQRAFTVWGHYFVAQLIISIPIFCIYFIFFFTTMRQILSGIPTP